MKTQNNYYVAYGSNLNVMQMGMRCPNARVYGIGKINGYKLTFRRVATIEPEATKVVPVGVWTLGLGDEDALDRYEGYPSLYRKETVPVEMEDGTTVDAMVYIMNTGKPQMPWTSYLDTIAQGYKDVGLDPIYLEDALKDTRARIGR